LVGNYGLIQVIAEDASGDQCPTGRQLRELIYCVVKSSYDMVELKAIELVL
jgi:hypothetical protein